ncbi:MAG: anti-sigma factor [Thiolinea sp.]
MQSKRYQNPTVFEHLALSYALGTLQGRARQRFEALQARHFYLRAVTQAYQQRCSGLLELLPAETPPPQVWSRIEKQLRLKQLMRQPQGAGNSPRFANWLLWPAMSFASVLAAVATVLFLHFQQPDMYFSKLDGMGGMDSVAMVTASQDDMSITVALADTMPMGKDQMPTLWCLSKKPGEAPMRMGDLKPAGLSELSIDKKTWQTLSKVGKLAISLEPMDHPDAREPMGEVIYEGALLSSL